MTFAPSAIRRTVDRRILFSLFFINVLAQIDRSNLSFAAVDLNHDLKFSSTVYGFGAGIFFVGLALIAVPQTFVFERIRPHIWLACMMGVWAVASMTTAFVQNPAEFFVARFVLGAAEAALVPAAVTCLSRFYTSADVGSAAATYVMGGGVAAAIGGPLAAAILTINGGGLESWQWLFVLQAIPVLLVAPFVARLAHSPAEARWLTPDQREWLSEHTVEPPRGRRSSIRQLVTALLSVRVWVLTLTFFCINLGLWGLTFWLPQIVKSRFTNLNSSQVTLVSSIAFIAAALGIYGFGKLSRVTGDRYWTLVALLAASAISLALSLLFTGAVAQLLFVSLGLALSFSIVGVFYGVPAATFTGPTGATGIAFVNGLGLLGGFVGPYLFGALKDATGATTDSLYVYAAVFLVAMVLVAAGRRYYPSSRPTVDGDAADRAVSQPSEPLAAALEPLE